MTYLRTAIGTFSAGGALVDGLPTFTGTAEPGATVTVSDGATVLCTATVDGAGNWSCTAATPLTEGSHNINVVATDPAGNTSTTAEVAVNVDSTAPIQTLITSPRSTIRSSRRRMRRADGQSTHSKPRQPMARCLRVAFRNKPK